MSPTKPRVLVINDDQSLLESRRMLLDACGAVVLTACGEAAAIRDAIVDPVDLILIDATNVGWEHGEKLCKIVREIRPEQRIGLLVQPETEVLGETSADRVILRTGPRRILVETNELLDGRLDIDLWQNGNS